jgi:methylated-DNA-protein-cysteine methyltransferase-like protein
MSAAARYLVRVAESFYDRVYRMVERIPRGRVTTYGHIAALCGKPRAARTVGWALHALPDESRVPWHRVINARGGISIAKVGLPPQLQRALLEREGVAFDADGRVDLERWGWIGPRGARRG